MWYCGGGRCPAGSFGTVSDVPRRASRQEVWVRPAGPNGSVSGAGLPRRASRREFLGTDSSPRTRHRFLVGYRRLRTRMRMQRYARQNVRQDTDLQRKHMATCNATRSSTTTNARQGGRLFADRFRNMLGNTRGCEARREASRRLLDGTTLGSTRGKMQTESATMHQELDAPLVVGRGLCF